MKKSKLGVLDRIRITIAARKLFLRQRRPPEVIAKAVQAYYGGLSLRRVAELYDDTFSKDAVRYWWNRLSHLFLYVGGPHAVVVVDETNIKCGSQEWIAWVAIDAETMRVITLKLARHQYNLDCRDFFNEIWHRSQPNRPIIIHDRGAWYKYQSEYLGLPHYQVKGGVRSLIECWNRQLKHRLDGFWRRFPTQTRVEQVERYLRAYAAVWNLQRGW